MPKYEIKTIVTGADQAAKDLAKPGKVIEDITAKLKAMDDAEQKALKTQRVHGDESQQMASHLSKLTQEAKAQGTEASKVVGIKLRWVDALKKLQHEVPGLSYVVGALKNPFVALIAIIALAINRLSAWNEEMQRLRTAVGTGKISEEFNNIGTILAQGKVDARELADQLERITGRPSTLEELGGKALADVQRNLAVEARADEQAKTRELAGAQDPVARAAIEARFTARAQQREQRLLGAKAEIATGKQFRAQAELRGGLAQLPVEQQALERAKMRREKMLGLAAAQEPSAAGLQEVEDQIAAIEKPGLFPSIVRQLRFGTPAERDATLAELKRTREGMLGQRQRAGILRATAEGEFAAAQGRFERFRGGLTGAAEQVRSFGAERVATAADADAFRPFNDPGAAARLEAQRALQARFDAQLAALVQAMTNSLKNTTNIIRSQTQNP